MNGSLQGERLEVLPSSGRCKSLYLAMLLSAILVTAILISNMEKQEQESARFILHAGTMYPPSSTGSTPSGRYSP